MNNKPQGQALAVPLKFGIESDFQQEFTWKQRWQIFFGYTLVIRVRIGCQHNPGEFIPIVECKTSPEKREKNQNLPPPS